MERSTLVTNIFSSILVEISDEIFEYISTTQKLIIEPVVSKSHVFSYTQSYDQTEN